MKNIAKYLIRLLRKKWKSSSLKRHYWRLLSQIHKAVAGVHTFGYLVKADEFYFAVSSEDMSLGRTLRQTGRYGVDELAKISSYIDENSNVIFVGGHIGALAIPVAHKVRRLRVIEANPNTYSLLELNVALNKIENIQLHNVAAGEKSGEIQFLLSRVHSGGSKRMPEVQKSMYFYDQPEIVSVEMVSIDDLLKSDDEQIDHIFMDIEGSEYFALLGMSETLKRTKNISVEFVPHHLRNVASISVEQFCHPLINNFAFCYIPTKKVCVASERAVKLLEEMFAKDESDEGIVFSKSPIVIE